MARAYSDLLDDDHNMLIQSQWPRQQREFADYLSQQGEAVEQIVAHHLSLRTHQTCKMAPRHEWFCGSFNICIPVYVKDRSRAVVRVPLSYRFATRTCPDMADEKIRGEAATFAWLSSNCLNVPIPRFWGFGLSDGRSFTALANSSWHRRLYEWLRRKLQQGLLRIDCWRPFVSSSCAARLRIGYLVMDFVEPRQGSMLRNKWPTTDPHHRQNLFRSLANILLDLMKVPLPRIGSFTVLDTGEVTLTGRPLTAALALLEAEEIPSYMPPGTTYPSTDSHVEDLLHCHETRLRDQPNAVEGENDAVGQLATVVVLRAVNSHFIDRKLRDGPFVFQFTDLHECNIFVDDQYNITSIIDLEWSCSLPVEMHQPQFWLSGHLGDDFLGDGRAENEATFLAAYNEFLDILRSEHKSRGSHYQIAFDPAQIIQSALERKSHWYFAAVSHPRTAYGFLVDHIQPRFAPSHTDDIDQAGIFQNTFLPYYAPNALKLVERKIEEKAKYDSDLRLLVEMECLSDLT
jgi:hypothetical protein